MFSSLVVLLLAFTIPGRVHAQAPQYTVTILGNGQAYGINASGQVVGESAGVATEWTGGTTINLGTLGGSNSAAIAINASGQVAGYSFNTGNSTVQATSWTGGTPTALGANGSPSYAWGINGSGQVIGTAPWPPNALTSPYPAYYATEWTGTTPTALNAPAWGSQGYGINASGQVAGTSSTMPYSISQATLWTGGASTYLPDLLVGYDNGIPLYGSSAAFGLNNYGQVVGVANGQTGGDPFAHAALWTGGGITDLGTLGGSGSIAFNINDSGEVTGMANTMGGSLDAFLYSGGTMYDLNSLLVPGSGVTGITFSNPTQYGGAPGGDTINNLGQIAAYGTFDGQQVALLLTPLGDDLGATPEPSTWALLLGGLGLLAFWRHRTRRA